MRIGIFVGYDLETMPRLNPRRSGVVEGIAPLRALTLLFLACRRVWARA